MVFSHKFYYLKNANFSDDDHPWSKDQDSDEILYFTERKNHAC